MAHLLTDELWDQISPLLHAHRSRPRGGRRPVDDRVALAGILFVLKTGIGWADLPREIGCSGMTCWRRLRDWQSAGVWDALHRLLLARLRHADRIDFSRRQRAGRVALAGRADDQLAAPVPPVARAVGAAA
jgi:transposase